MSAAPVFARVRASRGWLWLVSAHALFARARVYWLQLILGYWMITVLVSLIPVIGVIAATLLKPVFAVGFLAAAWSIERGEPLRFSRLFDGFRSNLAALIPLGAVYGAGVIAAVMLSSMMDGGALMRLALLGQVAESASVESMPGIQSALVFAALCSIPTLLALWFAPALVVFQDQPTWRALSLSLRASIANAGAILVYWIAVLFFFIVIPGVIIAVGALFGYNGARFGLALAMPVMMVIVAVIHAADYVIYRDLFHHGEAMAATARNQPDTRSGSS